MSKPEDELESDNIVNCCGVVQIWGFDCIDGDRFYEGHPAKPDDEKRQAFEEDLQHLEEYWEGKKFLLAATTVEQTNANKALENRGFTSQGPNRRIILWTKEL